MSTFAILQHQTEERYLVSLLLAATASTLREEALSVIDPEDFGDARFGAVWAAARRLREGNRAISHRTLVAESGGPGDDQLLSQIAGEIPQPGQFPHALNSVRRAGKLRRLVEAGIRIQQRAIAAEDFSQAYGWAIDELNALQKVEDSSDTSSYADLLDDFAIAMKSRENYSIIATPWGEVNEMIAGGLHGGRLYIVGARPGEGKSIVAHNLAEHSAAHGSPALVFSVEMGKLEVTGRMVASGAVIEQKEISRRELETHSWDRFHRYAEKARGYPLYINDRPDLSLGYIKAEARAQKRKTGLKVIAVDYLQLLKSDRSLPREQQVSHISRSLKELSRELDVAVVVPAQLNRNAVNRDKPSLADLRESGGIEADADVVMLLARQYHSDGPMKGSPIGTVMVDIAKNRHGRIGSVELDFRAHYSRIS
jgi:replicative DNA helicase